MWTILKHAEKLNLKSYIKYFKMVQKKTNIFNCSLKEREKNTQKKKKTEEKKKTLTIQAFESD